MMNWFETYFDAHYAYFTAETHQFQLRQFENLVYAIMSTRENIPLIVITPSCNDIYIELISETVYLS